ncbi:MAG: hypothetical protein DI532_12125 [Azospirillum brasilense]|nr:MAG: hypothetical protein DI532_12125 [Azospirillum brasilense]
MEQGDARREVWRQPLFLRPLQLELFGGAEAGPHARGDGGASVPLDDAGSSIARLLNDIYPKVRGGVVCMVSAARLQDLLPGLSGPLWLGVPLHTHFPRRDPADLRVLHWSNRPAFEVGIEQAVFCDVTIAVTSRERTIVDLVRYGRRVGGSATAARCLRAYVAAGGSREAVWGMADAMRMPHPARLALDVLLQGLGDPS